MSRDRDGHITSATSVLAAQTLVAAVAEHGDLAERHYLELKSVLDLSTKKDKEKIAKFILGAANRMPDVAATAFQGYAVMIIGVSQGQIAGIPPVEMMEIAKVVQQYVGAAGPHWDVLWVPIDGSTNQVLLVLVDPPAVGQGPFPCRASGDSLTNGRIYIRADGATREANADEFDLLLKRGAALPKVEVDFAVEVLGELSTVVFDNSRTVEEYLDAIRARMLAALPPKVPPTLQGLKGTAAESLAGAYSSLMGNAASFASALQIPEDRTEEEYLASISQWEDDVREAWGAAKTKIASSQLPPIVVKITNRTTTFFHDVEVQLHLEGRVYAYDYTEPEWVRTPGDLELPRPPRIWGPRERMSSLNYSHLAGMLPSTPHAYVPPSVRFKNGGSVDLSFDIGELRPLGTYESEEEEFVLVVDDDVPSIHGTWQLTARGHNEVYRARSTCQCRAITTLLSLGVGSCAWRSTDHRISSRGVAPAPGGRGFCAESCRERGVWTCFTKRLVGGCRRPRYADVRAGIALQIASPMGGCGSTPGCDPRPPRGRTGPPLLGRRPGPVQGARADVERPHRPSRTAISILPVVALLPIFMFTSEPSALRHFARASWFSYAFFTYAVVALAAIALVRGHGWAG